MRLIVIFLLLMVVKPFNSVGQGDINVTDSKGRKQGKWIKNYDGTNKKRYVGQFKDDKPTGEFVYYYSTGEASAVTQFLPDEVAYTKMYFANGNLMARGKYIEQIKDSTWWYFTEDKKMLSKENYENGKLNGEVVVYYPTDPKTEAVKVFEITNYKDGLKNGKWKQYFKSGKVKATGNYLDGNYHGKLFWYHGTGRVETEGFYKHAVKNGTWKYFDKEGNLEKKVYYKNGELLEGEELEKYLEGLKANK